MTRSPRNSVAAIMSVLVTVVMVLTGIFGAIVILLGGYEIITRLNGGEAFTARATEMSTPQLVAGLLGGAVVVAAVMYVCHQLQRILATLAAGDPFVPENAPRLSRIAIAIALTELARYAIGFAVRATVDGTRLDVSIDIIPWAAVAALFILSQVFREGTRLRDEEKFTI